MPDNENGSSVIQLELDGLDLSPLSELPLERPAEMPEIIADTLGSESVRRKWRWCGKFPHQVLSRDLSLGRRACRRYWRERGLNESIGEVEQCLDMLFIKIIDLEGDDGGKTVYLGRESASYEEDGGGPYSSVHGLFHANDWYLEILEGELGHDDLSLV